MRKIVTDAELEQDFDYIMHVEHELPMEWYTRLDEAKADIVKSEQRHIEAAVRTALIHERYRISTNFKDNVMKSVLEDATYEW